MDNTMLLFQFLLFGIISTLYYFRLRRFKKEKPSSSEPIYSIENRTKYPEVNVFRQRGVFLKLGLCMSLSFVLMAFSWTTEAEEFDYIDFGPMIEDLEVIPRTPPQKKTPPPKLPPPIIEEVKDEEMVEEPKLEPMEIDENTEIDPIIEEPIETAPEPIAPPPPPPEENDEDVIFSIAEEMPRFPGCNEGSAKEKRQCSDRKLLTYLSKNLKYPNIAKENGVQGKVYIQFVVNTDGSIQDAEIVRDIGAGCGKAALKVVQSMNDLPQKWRPGKQRGRKVRVKYTLPVTFRLD